MRYWGQRIGMAALLLFAVSALTFAAMNTIGNPLFNILGPEAGNPSNPDNAKLIAQAKAEFNLDDPLPWRYAQWLGGFFTGDMGVNFNSDGQPPVVDLIKERAPRSIMLLVLAQVMAIGISIPWALAAASRANKPIDRMSTVFTFLLVALPSFAMAIVLKYFLGVKWQLLPLTFTADDPFLSRIHQMLMPALTIALPAAAVYQRLLRTDLITTLQEDFILMARSKGVSRRRILFKHALRPSLFSFITVVGLNTGSLIGGSLVVEQVFRIPGLGSSLVESVLRDNFPVVLAIVMIVATAFVLINLLVDVAYSLIDPRVRK